MSWIQAGEWALSLLYFSRYLPSWNAHYIFGRMLSLCSQHVHKTPAAFSSFLHYEKILFFCIICVRFKIYIITISPCYICFEQPPLFLSFVMVEHTVVRWFYAEWTQWTYLIFLARRICPFYRLNILRLLFISFTVSLSSVYLWFF